MIPEAGIEGPIVFVCSGSRKHLDQEVLFEWCTNCNRRGRFYWEFEAGEYRCRACGGAVKRADLRCPYCGREPRVTHLKHLAR